MKLKSKKEIISNEFLQSLGLFVTIFGGIAGGLAFIGVPPSICFVVFIVPTLYILILHSVEKRREQKKCKEYCSTEQQAFTDEQGNPSKPLLIQITSNAINPFKCGGTLSADAPSYIQRECDRKLATALQTKKLIGIVGEYTIGKSSLLEQIPTLTTAGWEDCFMDFEGMRTDNVEEFIKEFFDKVCEIFADVNSWQKLIESLKHQPVIFRFDEFGALENTTACSFIPKLYNIHSHVDDEHIRIIACSPKPIKELLKLKTVDISPRYYAGWHTIPVQPFKPVEIRQMLDLLPAIVAKMVVAHCDTIISLSFGKPLALQHLCNRLFENAQKGVTPTELTAIIHNPDSYKEKEG